jgi:two-component system CheB/CheR fusion protein
VLDLLRKRTGHDFSQYKRATVLRRLSRRMQLAQQPTIGDYWRFLSANMLEADALFDDLLISVTAFFRDADTWAALQERVIGPLVEHTPAEQQIRVWVPGCSTGEEAYTLAILFDEEFARRGIPAAPHHLRVDSRRGRAGARQGGCLSACDQRRHLGVTARALLSAGDNHYRVVAELRDSIVFAAHNLLRDPPFSRLHLISCRNLLVYIDRDCRSR